MTTDDYLRAVKDLNETNGVGPVKIANFGFSATAIHEVIKQEAADRKVVKKDHLSAVLNAKRLLANFAREEKLNWEKKLKEKGLWTEAQEQRAQKLGNKTDFDLYARLETNFALEYGNDKRGYRATELLSQSMADGKAFMQDVNEEGETASQVNVARGGVEMMPQDDPRSEHDLGFMTEVDAEYKPPAQKVDLSDDPIVSTRYSEVNTSMPINRSSLLDIEQAEFKMVIKELISKEQSDVLKLEERILEKMKKRNLSKGWDRPTGAKVAPLKILQSMRS